MNMREKMARAMLKHGRKEIPWEDATLWLKDHYLAIADAALTALEEPTEAMLRGARDWSVAKYGIGIGNDAAIGCWRAMIRKAKDEPLSNPQ